MGIEDLKPIEPSVSIDVDKYIGKKVKIEKVWTDKVDSPFQNGKELPKGETVEADVLRVETEVLDTLSKANGDTFELRASEMFNLKKDENGNLGWGTSEKKPSKLQKFLTRMKCSAPKDLIGKEVRVQEGKNGFLTFPVE